MFADARAADVQDEAEAPARKKRRGGGGPFRAYCSSRLQGRRITGDLMREFAYDYQRLTPDARQFFQRAGTAATILHRQGAGSFPAFSKRARRRQGLRDEAPGARSGDDDMAVGDADDFNLPPPLDVCRALHECPDEKELQQLLKKQVAVDRRARRRAKDVTLQQWKRLQDVQAALKAEQLQHRHRLAQLHTCEWFALPQSCPSLSCLSHAGQHALVNADGSDAVHVTKAPSSSSFHGLGDFEDYLGAS